VCLLLLEFTPHMDDWSLSQAFLMWIGTLCSSLCCLNLLLLYMWCLCVVLLPRLATWLGCPPFYLLFLVLTYPWFLGNYYLLRMCLFMSYFLLLYLYEYLSNEDWNPLVIFPILNGHLYVFLLYEMAQF
jgi:hypothetical protein